MTTEKAQRRKQSLLDLSSEAARRAVATSETKGKAAEIGHVYVMRATAQTPVVWALVRRHPGDGRFFLAVPGDSGPLLEETDVSVSESEPTGPLTLRCGARAWVPKSALEPELFVGRLPSEVLERVEAVSRRIEKTGARDRGGPIDVGGREWIDEVVQPARAAVSGLGPAAGRERGLRLALAASLVATLGLLGWTLHQDAEVRRLVSQSGSVSSSVEPPLTDLPMGFLDPVGALRGRAVVLEIPPGARYLGLVLFLTESAAHPEYRVTLLGPADGGILWRSDGFSSSQPGEVRLALPCHLLSPGTYRILLEATDTAEVRSVGEYIFEVRGSAEGSGRKASSGSGPP